MSIFFVIYFIVFAGLVMAIANRLKIHGMSLNDIYYMIRTSERKTRTLMLLALALDILLVIGVVFWLYEMSH